MFVLFCLLVFFLFFLENYVGRFYKNLFLRNVVVYIDVVFVYIDVIEVDLNLVLLLSC